MVRGAGLKTGGNGLQATRTEERGRLTGAVPTRIETDGGSATIRGDSSEMGKGEREASAPVAEEGISGGRPTGAISARTEIDGGSATIRGDSSEMGREEREAS